MRNLQCTITDMRKKVFAEVAKLAYEGRGTIIPGWRSCPMS